MVFVFTMLFGGGLIPSYLVNTSLGLKNNFLVYILPGAFSCYNLILIMNFFKSIPRALEEAAPDRRRQLFQGAVENISAPFQGGPGYRGAVYHGRKLE